MKKRILSLILALSMVLSVFPLGAFAEGSTGDLVIGSDGYPVGSNNGNADCEGNGWTYSKIDDTSNPKGTLTLTRGTFDFSTTETVECAVKIESSVAEITGGTFNGKVTNHAGTISGGKFEGQ